jgi:solute carrier family 31 (copper transporter), member 1
MEDMNMGNGSSMPASVMEMIFFTSTMTPLYSSSWSPTNTGSYAATCIFLIALAAIFRGLGAIKHIAERGWLEAELHRRPIIVKSPSESESEAILGDRETKSYTLVNKKNLVPIGGQQQRNRKIIPWRLSVDVPRAILVTVIAGVGYLL